MVHSVRRLLSALLIVVLVVGITFTLVNLAPGDMVDVMMGEAGGADPSVAAAMRAQYGLDQPVVLRLLHYIFDIARLNFGFSFRQQQPVLSLIMERLPATILLMTAATFIAVSVALVLALVSTRRPGRLLDQTIGLVVLVAYTTPAFWSGLMLTVLFAVRLRWLPTGGFETLFSDTHGLQRMADIARHLVLPAVSLSLFHVALYTRLLRASLLDVMGMNFIQTARAKGLGESRVIGVHALGNALLPLVTMVGMQVGSTIGGAVVIESVFSWPGIGRLAFDSMMSRDTSVLLGIVLFSSILVIASNLAVDLLNAWIDPRTRRE